MGVDITYECLSSCTYRIYHVTYYDCTGSATTSLPGPPAAPSTFAFDINGTGAGCTDPTPIGGWQFVSYTEVTPICATFQTACTSGASSINGVLEAVFYQDYDFCNVNCPTYTIEWETCCRNYSITSGASGDGIYSGLTQIDLGLTPCNSSPQFTNPPVPYLCSGQTFTFNQGAFDPDGDSLVYSLGPCFDGPGQQVGYNAGYSPTAPLGAGWLVNINSFTGDITITPNPGGVVTGVLCVYVEEYRDGVLIGQVYRDMQVTVINCPSQNVPPDSLGLLNVTGGAATGFTVLACTFDQLDFDIPVIDPDANQTIKIFWDQNITGASFYDAANPAIPDTAIGTSANLPMAHFSWFPTVTGTYTFLVTFQDDGCPILGQNQYTVVINVIPCALNPFILTDRTDCYTLDLTAIPGGGIPPHTYTWSGNGNLSLNPGINQPSLTHTYPGPGTYYYTVTVSDDNGTSATVSDTIVLVNTATADAGPDISVCPGDLGTIGTPAQPGYTYSWTASPPIGFSGSQTVAQPTVTLNNTTTNPILVTYTVTATDSVGCTETDDVVVSFTPRPPSLFAVTNPVCVDDPSTIVYSGNNLPGNTYTWDFDGGTPAAVSGPGPHLITWATPGIKTLSLVVDASGCLSDTTLVSVTVNQIPTSDFNLDSAVCQNNVTTISYTGNASAAANYVWDFDGGTIVSGTGQGPYQISWATTGIKDVRLTVEEDGCIGSMTTQQIQVFLTPTATLSVPSGICQGDIGQVTYTGNGSPSANYTWDFDGGIVLGGAGQGPYLIQWLSPGIKSVCVQVTQDGCPSPQACQNMQVYATPVPLIAAVNDQCFDGNSFNFTYAGTPGVDSYHWDLGTDAIPTTSSAMNPTGVTYTTPGVKTVSLYVVENGCVSDTVDITFEVIPEPSANFTVGAGAICQGGCIDFTYTGSPAYTGQAYLWDFGATASPSTSTLQDPNCVTFFTAGTVTVTLTVDNRGCISTTTQTIDVFPSPVVDAGADTSFCDGEGGAPLNASVTGGLMPYGYQWTCNTASCGLSNEFIPNPHANPNTTTQYFLQVQDFNGCWSNIDSVIVDVMALPVIDAGPDLTICQAGNGVNLQASIHASNTAPGPFTYLWTPATGMNAGNETLLNPYVRPDTTTIYTLTATSVEGCSSVVTTLDTMSTVTVNVNPLPVASAGADTALCLGDTIQLQGYGINAGPDYTYTWTPNDSAAAISDSSAASPFVSPSFTTTYFLVVESNGCASIADAVEVTVNTLPTVTTGPVVDLCLGDSVQLNGAAAGDPDGVIYTYEWMPPIGLSDPNSAKPMAFPDTTTDYTLMAGSGDCFGPVDVITVEVRPTPVVEIISPDTIICAGDEIDLTAVHTFTSTLTASPVNYQWSPGPAIMNGLDSVVTVFPTFTTIYTVQASIAGSCPTTDEIKVEVRPQVNANITADASSICSHESTVLHANGGVGSAQYIWSPSIGLSDTTSRDVDATPDTTTTYQVIVQEGVCSDTAEYTLEVFPTPTADYFASQSSGCIGLEVSFIDNSQGADALTWDFGDGTVIFNEDNPTHIYTQAGTFDVTLTTSSAGGCTNTITLTTVTVTDTSFADFTSNPLEGVTQVLPDAKVEFTDLSINGVNWVWDFGDGETSGTQSPTHTYTNVGEYNVSLIVTDVNGCVSTVVHGPYIVVTPEVFFPNVFTPNGDGLYDVFEVLYTGSEIYNMSIYDRWGNKVFEADSPTEKWDGTRNNGGTPEKEGVYYYVVMIGTKAYEGHVTLMR